MPSQVYSVRTAMVITYPLSLASWLRSFLSTYEKRVSLPNASLILRTPLLFSEYHSCSANTTLVLLFFNLTTIAVSHDTRIANARYGYSSEAVAVQNVQVTAYTVLENIFWNTFVNRWPLTRIALSS